MGHSTSSRRTDPGLPAKDRVRFITHAGKQVLLIDLSDCTSRDIIEAVGIVQRVITAQPPKSVLSLADLTGADIDRPALTRMKEVAVLDRPHVKRAALVGIDEEKETHRKALQTFSVREFPAFKTREDALEYLTKD